MIDVLIITNDPESKGDAQEVFEFFLRKHVPIRWRYENGPENRIEILSDELKNKNYEISSGLIYLIKDLDIYFWEKVIPKRNYLG